MYGIVTSIRNWMFDRGILRQTEVKVPVVCIGNLVAGGSGKTPLVMWLVDNLRKRNLRPVVLSRGYGGKLAGPVLVNSTHKSGDVGDEPILIAAETGASVVISKDRVLGAEFIVSHDIGDIIILDDGFQHRYLKRDFNVVCVDITDEERIAEFVEGCLLPFGRFRENRDSALLRAQAVVLSHRAYSPKRIQAPHNITSIIPAGVPVFCSWLDSITVANSRGEILPKGDVYMVTGIANPSGVTDGLRLVGYPVVNASIFDDHHNFTREDEQQFLSDAGSLPIVCTPKDFVRLSPDTAKRVYRISATLTLDRGAEFLSALKADCRILVS